MEQKTAKEANTRYVEEFKVGGFYTRNRQPYSWILNENQQLEKVSLFNIRILGWSPWKETKENEFKLELKPEVRSRRPSEDVIKFHKQKGQISIRMDFGVLGSKSYHGSLDQVTLEPKLKLSMGFPFLIMIKTQSEIPPKEKPVADLADIKGSSKIILESNDGKRIKCGKRILARSSKIFEAILNHECKETTESKITIGDFNGSVVKQFCGFIHFNKIKEDANLDLLRMAHLYGVDALVQETSKQLIPMINTKNVLEIIATTKLLGLEADDLYILSRHYLKTCLHEKVDVEGLEQFKVEHPGLLREDYLPTKTYKEKLSSSIDAYRDRYDIDSRSVSGMKRTREKINMKRNKYLGLKNIPNL